MTRILLVCCLAISQPSAFAIDISIGTARLSIPTPAGYSPVPSGTKYAELAKHNVAPGTEQLALFLLDADAALVAKGELPESPRKFCVGAPTKLMQASVTTADFAKMKRLIKSQNEEVWKELEAQMPGLLQKINKGVLEDLNVDWNVSVNQILPLPPHYETERGLAYLFIVKYNANVENGKPSVIEAVCTTTFLHLRGKVLFLYAYAEKPGLGWTRSGSERWADSIMAANPSVEASTGGEASSVGPGFNWGKVAQKALAGAIIGAIFGGVGYMFKKSRKG